MENRRGPVADRVLITTSNGARRNALAALGCGLALLGIAGCDPPAANAAGEAWPLSHVERPAVEVDSATTTGEEGALASLEAGVATDQDGQAVAMGATSGIARPAADFDPSGVLMHPQPAPPEDFANARFARPQHVRGLYVNAWAAGSNARMTELIELAQRTEVNSFVIDIKDVTGYVSHATSVPLAREIGADKQLRIRDLPALLDRLEAAGIYPIARIGVVRDSVLAAGRPEIAVQDTAGGIWVDSKGLIWMNPFSEALWEYNIQLAREVAEMGFPEIQWDYIRFPDAPVADMERALFAGSEGKGRVDAIRGFLTRAREDLSDLPVRSTADVFGVTTSFRRDIGLGQLWEGFIDVVDVALPMVYPSHYWEGSFGQAEPNAFPYEVVLAALQDARRRSASVEGAGLTRPWLQDFTLGKPAYGAPEVRAQIQAAYDAGIQEWVLWNPSTRYTEDALAPADGFTMEPIMRVAGVLTPVSRRHQVIDSVARVALLPPGIVDTVAAKDSSAVVDGLAATDSAAAMDGLATDSTAAVDSLAADSSSARDSLAATDSAEIASRSPSGRRDEL